MDKQEKLRRYLKGLGRLAVAFSGGVDSAYLLKTAHDVLGDSCAALTVRAVTFPPRELDEAAAFCKSEGIKQYFIDMDVFGIDGFAQNPKNRCYICKTAMLKKMRDKADELGIEHIAEGTNKDDEGDYRPGLAAVAEQGIISPLREMGMTKTEIRQYSAALGLYSSNKPSFACLATRFEYGQRINAEDLGRITAAEEFLTGLDLTQVRVRLHGDMARIEVLPTQFTLLCENAQRICGRLTELGFSHITMDLAGYGAGGNLT